MLFYLLERAMRTAREGHLLAGAVELSLRYDDWKQLTARQAMDKPTDCDEQAFAVVLRLLEQLYRRRVALRHVGVVLSRLARAGADAELFAPREIYRSRDLHAALDEIRGRWGHAAVVSGESIGLLGKLRQDDYGFVLRTPSLTK